ncbi:MAG TPA: vanadium-dependent haloperoxidase [Steroidobacteraceae bacterium]
MLSISHWAASGFVLLMALLVPRGAEAERSNGDVIVEWNQLLQTNITGLPVGQPRSYAMLQVAMADAVVAIEGQYRPFHAQFWAPSGASAEAAAAQAGHDVLVTLFPAAQAAADAALANRLARISPGRADSGVQAGKNAAAAILAWRQNDGYTGANPQPPAFLASTLPGIWVPTATGPYQFSLIYNVTPFGLRTQFQFLPTPFPQLESTEYAEAFNEVKDIGRSDSTVRTPEQGRFAQLAAGVGAYANVTNVFRLWSNVARDVSRSNSLSLVDTARLFAMMWASMHDSILTSHSSKAVYRLWRPETAIAHADVDGNPATNAEPGWAPLIPTPPYPAYSSDMTCLATGASRMLAHVLGSDAQSFTATWYTATGSVVFAQPYTGLWALADDEAHSRIWGGIHYRFDINASQVSCTEVADYLFEKYMRPRHED